MRLFLVPTKVRTVFRSAKNKPHQEAVKWTRAWFKWSKQDVWNRPCSLFDDSFFSFTCMLNGQQLLWKWKLIPELRVTLRTERSLTELISPWQFSCRHGMPLNVLVLALWLITQNYKASCGWTGGQNQQTEQPFSLSVTIRATFSADYAKQAHLEQTKHCMPEKTCTPHTHAHTHNVW